MEKFITEIVHEEFCDGCFYPGPFKDRMRPYLPFIPRVLDAISPLKAAGADEAYQGQLFDFVFLNIPFDDPFRNKKPGIFLIAGLKAVKTGHEELRELIYRCAKEHRALFNLANSERVGSAKNCALFSRSLCTVDDFRRLPLDHVKIKLREKFRRFVQHQFPLIVEMLSDPTIRDFVPRS